MKLHKAAIKVSEIEGGKINLSIAEIKEVLKCVGIILANDWMYDSEDTYYRMIESGKRHIRNGVYDKVNIER